MGLPGHRRTSSHKRRRASHFALGKTSVTECQKCKLPVLPHRACKNCGFYRGRTVIDTTRAVKRLVKRTSAKAGSAKAGSAKVAAAKDDHAGHDHAKDHDEKKKA